MAIIEQLEVKIRVADTPLSEYDVPDESRTNVKLQSETTSLVKKTH